MKMDWDFSWTIQKEDLNGNILEVVRLERNGLTDLGRQFVLNAILGLATTNFYDIGTLGVGNGTEPFDPSQIGLQGTDQTFQVTDNAYLEDGDHITWTSLFFSPPTTRQWREFAVFDDVPVPGQNFIEQFAWGTENGAPTNPTGGYFVLSSPDFPIDGSNIPWDITYPDLQDYLQANVMGAGSVIVTDLSPGNRWFQVELAGTAGDTQWNTWTLDTSNLTGDDQPYIEWTDVINQGVDAYNPLMLNRRVANLGDQPPGQNWRLWASAYLRG